jgi:alpha-1,2-mannosyltransferase
VNKNNHPPFATFLAVPLASFSYPQAITIWSIVTIIGFFTLGWIVIKELQFKLAPEWYLLLIGVAACWYPFYGHIGIGQLSIVICLCVVGAWALLRHGRDFTGGLLLGLSISVKLYPGLLLVVLILRRRWRAVWGALVFILASMILILVFINPQDIWYYVTQIIPQDAKEWANFPINFSIYGLFGKLFRDSAWIKPISPNPSLASVLSILSSLALFTYVVYQVQRMPRTRIGDDTAYAVTSLAMLLLSPVIWFHALLLLPLQFGLLLYDSEARKNQRFLLLCLTAFLLVSIPDVDTANALMAYFAPYRMPWYASLLLLTPDAGILLLWFLLSYKLKWSKSI